MPDLKKKKQKQYNKSLYKHYDSPDTKEKKKQAFTNAYKAAKWYKDVVDVMGADSANKMVNKKQVNMGERYMNWFLTNRG